MKAQALTFRDTTLGKKYAMAVSGLVLFGFVIGHMLGNLQVFISPEAINEYTKTLHETPTLLWGTRVVVVTSVVVHIVTAIQLTMHNKSARPVAYAKKVDAATTYAAKAMPLTGLVLVAYIIYHLAHLTFGYTAGLGYQDNWPDVYSALVNSFKVPWCAGAYIFAQVCLALHLYHGSWSLFQSLGLNHKRYNETLRSGAAALALAVSLGFMSIPIAVWAGILQ